MVVAAAQALYIQPMTLPASTTAFLLPEDDTAQAAIAAIGEELAFFDDWMDRYQFIIELGRKLPRISSGMAR